MVFFLVGGGGGGGGVAGFWGLLGVWGFGILWVFWCFWFRGFVFWFFRDLGPLRALVASLVVPGNTYRLTGSWWGRIGGNKSLETPI